MQKFKNEHTLTDEQDEVLGILQEEAAEVIQELSKLRRSGPEFCRRGTDVPNMRHLQYEIMDFMIILELATATGLISPLTFEEAEAYIEFKHEKLRNWSGLGNVIQRIQERDTNEYASNVGALAS